MAKAAARHILVRTQDECETLKQQIEAGADFAANQDNFAGLREIIYK